MSSFKIVFPAGYNIQNVYNDNIDINVVLPDKTVFFATFFTILNIQTLIKNDDSSYFWSEDMVLVKDLKKETIREAVSSIIEDGYLEFSFSKIGTIENVYPKKKYYEEILDGI